MSGFEWFFAIISIAMMLGSFWLRAVEDREMTMCKIRLSNQRRHPRV